MSFWDVIIFNLKYSYILTLMKNLNKMYFNKLLDNNDYEISSYVKKYFR